MERHWVAVLGALVLASHLGAPAGSDGGDWQSNHSQLKSGPAVLIWAVLPDAYNSSETVILRNAGSETADISGWSLTDNEGTMVLSDKTLAPDEELVICQSAHDYRLLAGEEPDMTYKSGWASTEGSFKLANDADEVLLLDDGGSVRDAFIFGKSVYAGDGWTGPPAAKRSKGEFHCRSLPRIAAEGAVETGWKDTDASEDWISPVKMTLGSSRFQAGTFHADGGTLFLSPDCSLEVMTEAIRSAADSIAIHVYELASSPLTRELSNASTRGVSVRILIEGEPVGGISADCMAAAWALNGAGADLRQVSSANAVWGHRRFEFVHCKYAVFDNASFIMTSENFKDTGYPCAGARGNRGWGAWVESEEGANYLAGIFESDWSSPESVACAGCEGPLETADGTPWTRKSARPVEIGPFDFSLFVTPDCALAGDPVLELVESAAKSLLVEEFYIYTHWGGKYDTVETAPNPYLEGVVDAARRGVKVRVILDATDYNVDPQDTRDNDDTARYINGIAEAENLDMEARLISPLHQFAKVHNKGVVADGTSVLISSINWNENSPCANRESAIVIRSEGASYFEEAFWRDWMNDLSPPVANITCQSSAGVGEWVALSAGMSADDAGIVNCSWCVDGDGEAEAWGMEAGWTFRSSGTKTIALTVTDEGGNQTTAYAKIRIEAERGGISPWWALAGVAVIVVIAGLVLFLRR